MIDAFEDDCWQKSLSSAKMSGYMSKKIGGISMVKIIWRGLTVIVLLCSHHILPFCSIHMALRSAVLQACTLCIGWSNSFYLVFLDQKYSLVLPLLGWILLIEKARTHSWFFLSVRLISISLSLTSRRRITSPILHFQRRIFLPHGACHSLYLIEPDIVSTSWSLSQSTLHPWNLTQSLPHRTCLCLYLTEPVTVSTSQNLSVSLTQGTWQSLYLTEPDTVSTSQNLTQSLPHRTCHSLYLT